MTQREVVRLLKEYRETSKEIVLRTGRRYRLGAFENWVPGPRLTFVKRKEFVYVPYTDIASIRELGIGRRRRRQA